MVRGGANGGPQYNPMNVSATGGAGQSGKYVAEKVAKATQLRPSGFPQGENKALAEQMTQGGNVSSTASAANPASRMASPAMGGGIAELMSAARPIDSEPSEYLPISDGVDFGRGRGSEVMPPSLQQDNRQIENVELIQRYMPDLLNAARMPGAPDSYKRMINSLMREIM
jgi:hypothetical protein